MAFNINITKKGNIDFEELNSLCGDIDRFYITIFPIIKNPFQKEQGIGLLLNLVEKKYTVVELYNGETIDQNNIQLLKDMLE